ncbi:MAG: 16S rRNA (cytosine(967)-C(5))-methyltransferase RsmB [Eubacteriales bacterium]|nr:16S rRNA (cytosine(967)-C(5))-methyltransferase RsmB [Eubacteriales bacterium]
MTDSVNIRELVCETLLAVHKEGRQSHLVIRDVLEKYSWLDQRDRAFYLRLTEGTLERVPELDYIINCFSSVKVNKMKPFIREVIRIAVYQMKYMDSVPDSAAVNESVKLAVSRGFRGLRGFVNGVLRSVSRGLAEVKYPTADRPSEYLQIRYSMPAFLADKWIDAYGPEQAEKICAAFLEKTPVTVRIRAEEKDTVLAELKAAGMEIEKAPLAPDAWYLKNTGDITAVDAFRNGQIIMQDISSQLAVLAAGIRPGDLVMDLCAAPGGKTIYAADLTGPEGKVISRDLSYTKTDYIRENLERCRLTNVEVEEWDGTVPDERKTDSADVVIADVPCSGYGVIGRKPDIKYNASKEKEESLQNLQRQILTNAVSYVKPGGHLLFSTCTFGETENESTAKWLAEEFSLVLEEERQFLPGSDPCDGFYYARFLKSSEA